jgi:hypothetical protein
LRHKSTGSYGNRTTGRLTENGAKIIFHHDAKARYVMDSGKQYDLLANGFGDIRCNQDQTRLMPTLDCIAD